MSGKIDVEKLDQICGISSNTEGLPKSYKRILEFFRNNRDMIDLDTLSISKLSKKLDVDPSNITRFCQHFGFSGFSDFKFSLKHNTGMISQHPTAFFGEDHTSDTLISLQRGYQQIIGEVFDLLDPKLIDLAAKKIVEAEKVHIYSQDGNMMAAQFAQFILWQSGVPCYLFSDTNLALASTTRMGPKDVAIGIAFSGDAILTVDPILSAKDNQAFIIAICGFNTSKLAKSADISLCCNAQIPDDIRSIPIALICETAIISAIQSTMVNKYANLLEPHIKDTVGIIQKNRYNV